MTFSGFHVLCTATSYFINYEYFQPYFFIHNNSRNDIKLQNYYYETKKYLDYGSIENILKYFLYAHNKNKVGITIYSDKWRVIRMTLNGVDNFEIDDELINSVFEVFSNI
jgi:hypothetical protein